MCQQSFSERTVITKQAGRLLQRVLGILCVFTTWLTVDKLGIRRTQHTSRKIRSAPPSAAALIALLLEFTRQPTSPPCCNKRLATTAGTPAQHQQVLLCVLLACWGNTSLVMYTCMLCKDHALVVDSIAQQGMQPEQCKFAS